MPRPTRRPLASSAADIDRKEIERRAREAAMPAKTEEKGRWPFSPGDAAKDESPRSAGPEGAHKDKAGSAGSMP